MRILLAELQLEGKVEVLSRIFPQKLADMFKHGVYLGDSEGAMVDGERFLLIDPEIEVPESCLELIFDIPCLTLVDHANFGTGKGAGIVRSGDRHVGNEQLVAQISHPVDGQVIGMGGRTFIVVLVNQLGGADLHQVLEMLLSLVEQVAHPQQQPQEYVFYLHYFINLSQIKINNLCINYRSPPSPPSPSSPSSASSPSSPLSSFLGGLGHSFR